MIDVRDRKLPESQEDGLKAIDQNSDVPNLTDEERFARISKDPYFMRKAGEAAKLLSGLEPNQEW